jgi:beta-lactamase regulating signal transducer with metallopeptidase domain
MTMPDLWTLLSAPTVERLGWTLLHVVWQGALVAALLAGALRALRRHGPRVRYAASLAALVALLALPVTTGVLLHDPVGPVSPAASPVAGPETAEAVAASPAALEEEAGGGPVSGWAARVSNWVRPALPGAVLAWGLGVMGLAIRWMGGAWRVRRLRQSGTAAPTEWRDRLSALADRMGLARPVALRRSARVDGPMVAGWWRPVILVPAGLLSGLPPRQVEALLLHELAHVRRHDVLVGHLQALVETLLFFHPATWWVSGRVRAAREACCDDLAVQGGAERTVVARALAALAEGAAEGRAASWAPAASGGSLLTRIRRLLTPERTPSPPAQRLSGAAAVLLVVGLPLGLAACASQQSTSEAGEPPAEVAAAPADTVESDDETVVVLRSDSTERTVRFGADGPVEVDRRGDGTYVLRHDGRTDTLDGPRMEGLPDADVLTPPRPPFAPDSLERALRRPIDPDSLARVVQARIGNPDSLARAVLSGIDPDEIVRTVRMRINPDSIRAEALEMRLRADSLARRHRAHADSLRRRMEQMRDRMRREMPEHLREQARHLREQAERLEERAREMETPASPAEPTPPDSGRG